MDWLNLGSRMPSDNSPSEILRLSNLKAETFGPGGILDSGLVWLGLNLPRMKGRKNGSEKPGVFDAHTRYRGYGRSVAQ
jgi:hypothetical protein